MTTASSVYEHLADRLSNTPNGLPRKDRGGTQAASQVFAPEQATLAVVLELDRVIGW